MGERQIHGFIFENNYIKENNLTKENNYTSEFDAYDSKNIPYQIKIAKYKSGIDMGDIFRNFNKSKDFYLIVAFWFGNKYNIIETHRLFIPYKKWCDLLRFDYYNELKSWIQNVPNSRDYDCQWKNEVKAWKKKFNNMLIKPRFKRDHKNQKRTQCGISNKDFYSYFIREFSIGK